MKKLKEVVQLKFIKKKDENTSKTIFIDKDSLEKDDEHIAYLGVDFIGDSAKIFFYKENLKTGRYKYSPAVVSKEQNSWILKKQIEISMK